MKPGADALLWANKMRFGCFTSWETIAQAYAAHLRIIEKAKQRRHSTFNGG